MKILRVLTLRKLKYFFFILEINAKTFASLFRLFVPKNTEIEMVITLTLVF